MKNQIKVKIWRKCYLSLTIKWKLVASKLYNQSFCSDLKATDTIPPAHTHTMLVWIPKLASSQSSIYHCFAQLFDFLCRDMVDWRQNINWPSLYSNSPPHKKNSAMHFGLWFLCTRSSSRPQLFEEWQTPQGHWNSQRARPFIQCTWATCCRSEITDTIDSFHFTSEVELYCQLWPSNFPKCFSSGFFHSFQVTSHS